MTESIMDISEKHHSKHTDAHEQRVEQFNKILDEDKDNKDSKFIINVYGKPGLGKTSLLINFRNKVRELNNDSVKYFMAWADERDKDVMGVLNSACTKKPEALI